MLMSVKEYAAKAAVSPSTVQRRLSRGELKGRRFGRAWYVELEASDAPLNHPSFDNDLTAQDLALATPTSGVSELVSFSSKALNSYLMMSDRLIEEKERAFQEKIDLLKSQQQRVAELESYVRLLEGMLTQPKTATLPSLPELNVDPCGVMQV